MSPYVQVRADLCHLPLTDQCADIVHCSHVLEHVPDDRAAMAELVRVLRPDGWGLIQVPVWSEDPTFEDASITDPSERKRVYGQDVVDRLRSVGLTVDVIPAAQFLSTQECERHAI
ncbi:MAG: SAM-dependent methyltransferase, partial [Gemmatimonadetes bacterium]|nr:SAM-dependent methyltransferase [Gemmatimonadota bacterium]